MDFFFLIGYAVRKRNILKVSCYIISDVVLTCTGVYPRGATSATSCQPATPMSVFVITAVLISTKTPVEAVTGERNPTFSLSVSNTTTNIYPSLD